jgi:3-oxoacyl-[acyl-carrier protein] reductase
MIKYKFGVNKMDLGIKNRVGIVTGSSKGIGRAIAESLAKEGVNVVICSRNIKNLNNTAKDIENNTGTNILPVQADITKMEDINKIIEETIQQFGKINILINNISGPPSMYFSETTDNDWRKAVEQLLMSVVNFSYGVIPYMKKNKWGRIINMTSFAAKQPQEGLILSNTIRAGILGLTKTLSNELSKENILVNAVCPGWTLTDRLEELAKSKAEKNGKNYKNIIKEWENEIPIGRLAQPQEIANLVTFLASEPSSYITGCSIQVDGGFIKSII